MLLGLYADPHFSQSSSIIVGRKGKFTGRLNNLIESFTWMNEVFKEQGVDKIICLGDMTDKPNLTAEEITALSRCNIDDHILIVGNHCRADKDGKINSLATFNNVIDTPQWICDGVYALPYNSDTVNLSEISPKPRVILSHNDIKGYEINGYIMNTGYEISKILDSCDLFVNGHLHSGGKVVVGRIINLGQLSAMNFSSCNSEWEPSIMILDTDTLTYKLIENPKAYRFKKESFEKIPQLKSYLDNLPENHNYVLQVKVPYSLATSARKLLDQSKKIVASRVLTKKDKTITQTVEFKDIEQVPIFTKLSNFIKENPPKKYNINLINEIINKISKDEEFVS